MRKIIFFISSLVLATSINAQEPFIKLKTEKNPKENITISIKVSKPEYEGQVWIDLNGNSIKDEGEAIEKFGEKVDYAIDKQEITIYGPVWVFSCNYQKLSKIEISPNHDFLNQIWCGYNQIEEIDLSSNTKVSYISCQRNRIMKLLFNPNSRIKTVSCRENLMDEKAITEMIASLPDNTNDKKSELLIIDTSSKREENEVTSLHVTQAKAKNWSIFNQNGKKKEEYKP